MDQFESRISHLRRVGVSKIVFFGVGLSPLARRVMWSLKTSWGIFGVEACGMGLGASKLKIKT